MVYHIVMKRKLFESGTMIYEDTDYFDFPIRVYDSGNGWQSATFLEEDKKYDLVFNYLKAFNRAFDIKPDIKDILLLGGAGYAYPKYVISHYPEVSISVVEIDPEAFELAKQHFFLDDLIREYGDNRLINITDDAVHYIKSTDNKYDLIINDLYADLDPVYQLLTNDGIANVKKCLKDNGIYSLNLSGNKKLDKTDYLLNIIKTLSNHFKNVSIVKAFSYQYLRSGNYVLFASDSDDKLPDSIPYDLTNAVPYEDADKLKEDYHEFLGI